jgi:hypothetical protein
MRHLRSDYNVIQDIAQEAERGTVVIAPLYTPLAPTSIGEDEPVFVLRARDIAAPATVEDWCNLVEMRPDHDPVMLRSVRKWANEMRNWQHRNLLTENSAKTPDVDTHLLIM